MLEGVVYVAGCAFALWEGGRPERIVAVAIALGYGLLAAAMFGVVQHMRKKGALADRQARRRAPAPATAVGHCVGRAMTSTRSSRRLRGSPFGIDW